MSGEMLARLLCFCFIAFPLAGCARSTDLILDAGMDGGGAVEDAAPFDAAPAVDAGRDGGPPPDTRLGEALTRAMDADTALAGIVRFVACTDTRATVVGLMEAWEAGLLSAFELSGGLVEGYDADLGCEAWRCLASAGSCELAAACMPARDEACEPSSAGCDADVITTCAADGSGARRLFDCATLGARCEEGRCHLGDCVFGAAHYQLECEGDALTICEGAVRMPCEAWAPGSSCTSFAIGGEVPTQWCSPSGVPVSGAYSRPVDCDDGGSLSFASVSTRVYRFDCLANGYAGCEDRGCVR
jgi:hypothetical protein